MKPQYAPPQIHHLGNAANLVEGSYPHTPETFDTYNRTSVAKKGSKKKAAKKKAAKKKAAKKKAVKKR